MNDKTIERNWTQLLAQCAKNRSPGFFASLFHELLTENERVDLVKRLLVFKMLIEGKESQRSIAKQLDVSIVKITRCSNCLKQMDSKIIEFIKKEIKL